MHKLAAILGVAVVFAGLRSAPASASVYGDDLGKCIVEHASPADRTLLVRWIYGAMSVSPGVAAMAKVSSEDRTMLSKQAVQLMVRLLADDCHAQSVAAIKYDGSGAIETAFELLGRVAMRDLMTDPAVSKELAALGQGVDTSKLDALMAEGGVSKPTAK
jgi:hypothetical protein